MSRDPRHTSAWRELKKRVVREEPVCWLQLPDVCNYWSQTADHVLPVVSHPELALTRSNLRGVCYRCNSHRQDKPVEGLPGKAAAPDLLGYFD